MWNTIIWCVISIQKKYINVNFIVKPCNFFFKKIWIKKSWSIGILLKISWNPSSKCNPLNTYVDYTTFINTHFNSINNSIFLFLEKSCKNKILLEQNVFTELLSISFNFFCFSTTICLTKIHNICLSFFFSPLCHSFGGKKKTTVVLLNFEIKY